MNTGTVFVGSAAAPLGRLLSLLAAAALVLAALTGNSFSLHGGMTASASEAVVAVDSLSDTVAGAVAVFQAGVGDVAPGSAAPMPVGTDAQHLMHLIGACLAVLAAAALLLRLFSRSRALLGSHPAVTALPRLLAPRPEPHQTGPCADAPTFTRGLRA